MAEHGSPANTTSTARPFGFEAKIMIGVASFFLVVMLVYWFWSNYEFSGSVLLFGTILLGFLPGSYLMFWSRRLHHPRPEDRDDATHAEAAGPIASFPDASIWPFMLGMGASLLVIGFVFPFWMAIIGGSLAFGALVGVVLESRRGGTI